MMRTALFALVWCLGLPLVGGCAEGPGGGQDDGGRGDGGMADADAACKGDKCANADAGSDAETDAGPPCEGKCADDEVCFRDECVVPKACEEACSAVHPCLPSGECDCTVPDVDKDGHDAEECGGDDCDDEKDSISPSAQEVCTIAIPSTWATDEDCNPNTAYKVDPDTGRSVDGDADGDGYPSSECVNFDAAGEVVKQGEDCNDANDEVHPGRPDFCDYRDNDCDGLFDELDYTDEDGNEASIDKGLRRTLYPDRDGDGFGTNDDPDDYLTTCFGPAASGSVYDGLYVESANDCDDDDDEIYPGAPEQCNGKDNDCDGVDESEDEDFDINAVMSMPGHVFACTDGEISIVDCPEDMRSCGPAKEGCQTDETLLTSCRSCVSDCRFSCGQDGCDEIDQVSAGSDHTCAVTGEGRVACWGRALQFRLGHETFARSYLPLWSPGVDGVGVRSVSAGGGHTCTIVGDDHQVWCWGDNRHWQLGTGGVAETVIPRVVKPSPSSIAVLQGAAQVVASTEHTCVRGMEGDLLCWGEGARGRLANGSVEAGTEAPGPASRLEQGPPIPGVPPVALAVPAEDIADFDLGWDHGCAINDARQVECWGSDEYGQLGNGATSTADTGYLEPVAGLDDVDSLTCGALHTCAVVDGSVYCWGDDSYGQLGPRDVNAAGEAEVSDDAPGRVAGVEDAVQVVAGLRHTCALKSNEQVVCWGDNAFGQLGVATNDPAPVVVDDPSLGEGVRVLTAGSDHTCALLEDSSLVCWGANLFGQLGTGVVSATHEVPFVPALPVQGDGQ